MSGRCSSLVSRTLNLMDPKLLLIESCTTLTHFKIVHAYMIRTQSVFDVFPASRLIASCIDKSLIDYALGVLSQVESPNLFIFNAFIRAFSSTNCPDKSLCFYAQSRNLGLFPDNLTYPFLVKACTELGSLKLGAQVHDHVMKFGFGSDLYVQNSILHMYAALGDVKAASFVFRTMPRVDVVSWTSMIAGYSKVGDVGSARQLFEEMPERNLVTWGTMISGYARNHEFDKAVELYGVLRSEGVQANETVMVSVISSCAHLGALGIGERAHDYVVRNKMSVNMVLGTALVDMYARCGCLEKAIRVFDELPEKDALSWTALVGGFAMNGYPEKALEYFSKMVTTGLTPRDITYTAVLSACSHGGLVERGLEVFESMERDYGIQPRMEHYGCVVDLLGRAGKLLEAEKFIREMPVKPNAPILGALLGACRIHKDAAVAERVGKSLIELLPEHSGYYVLLSNIYARTSKWENVENTRQVMKERGVMKPPGYTVIEIEGKLHKFTMGDRQHPEIEEIEKTWVEILKRIKLAGYTGNTADALFDIDEEEKESAILRHSEKLAIAYGIMKTKAHMPIRIVKNLRVCADCHTTTKLISLVYDKELIVRDRNRFHHFKGGVCSCHDFW